MHSSRQDAMNAPGGELLNKDEGHGMKPFDLPSLFLPKKLSEKHFKAACTHTMHHGVLCSRRRSCLEYSKKDSLEGGSPSRPPFSDPPSRRRPCAPMTWREEVPPDHPFQTGSKTWFSLTLPLGVSSGTAKPCRSIHPMVFVPF